MISPNALEIDPEPIYLLNVDSDPTKFRQRTRHRRWMTREGQPDLASIIIPTFNRQSLLEEALASVASQTYRPIEIIVVDDGSTDSTGAVVDRWREKLAEDGEASLRYFFQPNVGVGAARNRGLIESRGQFIQFLDSDDLLNPHKLALHIDCLKRNPEAGYAFSDFGGISDSPNGAEISIAEARLVDSADLYCRAGMLAMVGVIRRETCYATGPWCEDLRIGVDEEFSLRSLLATKKVVYLPGSLCAVRQHSGPRLMDGQNKAHGLELELLAYRRMAECAALRGCLSDPRILLPLSQHITGVIVRSLQTGNARVAAEAIRTCGELPVEMGRRIRLKLYQMLSLMPPGMFLRFRWVWLKTRQMVFEMPKRAIDRSRAGRIARDREQVTT